MFGRLRKPSLSSLEELELERSHSKITKDDPLSIYETTLRKLKEGSKRSQTMLPEDAIMADNSHMRASCSLGVDHDCSSTDSSLDPTGCQSVGCSREERNRNMSVLYLFSKYRSSKTVQSSPNEEAMVMENACSSTSTPSVHHCQYMSSSGQHLQEKYFDSPII